MNTSGNILLVFFLFFAFMANGQDAYWQQRTNYKISVQLNTDFHTLDGFEKITYINHSPDTLTYIWFHLWPNAFKNDRTAFSDQLIENGRTDFYFSESNERGYINRLDFRINDVRADVEDHPEHIDIVKLILPKILYPNDSIIITTPFHVQLPKNFSRGGHIGKTYQLTQWYPKPAVYDRKGWHPMPYLDQGEFYGEYGDYEVEISLPKSYHVLSTGSLAAPDDASVTNTDSIKTLVFKQQKVHDFAWFASKTLQIKRDSIQLPTGRVLQLQAAHLPEHKKLWESSIAYMKQAVLERTGLIGAYEYDILSIVEVNMKNNGGMEYPCIATIHNVGDEKELETIIKHEIGHNWFQGMIGNNERAHAWMDEGINTYYDRRLDAAKNKNPVWKFFVNYEAALARTYQRIGKDQAVSVASDKFSSVNYYLSAYHKAADILELIEQKMGRAAFDEAMRNYFNEWKFSHPYPTDFFAKLQQFSSWRLDSLFQLFDKKGELPVAKSKYKLNLSLLPGLSLMKENRIAVTPLVGYNITDGFMAGAAISNYTLPPSKFQWLLAPLYGTQSKAFNYAGRMSYTWYPSALFERIVFSVSGMKFNTRDFTDTAGNKYITGFRRFVPSVKWVFKSDNPRSTREKYVQWKTFIIDEDRLRFTSDTFTNGNRFLKIKKETSDRLLHQLSFVLRDTRALYPYNMLFQVERAELFTRLNFTGNYYFNYNQKQGAHVRLFAGKFIYNTERSFKNIFATDPFHLNLTGPRGNEDYTYSNYFIGRNEFEGLASQQIMMRDGGFKVRTDLLADKVGKTDDWLMAINIVSDIPDNMNLLKILPFDIPLKVFLDVGTFADTWQQGYEGSKILYNAGFQLPLLKNTIQVYIPVLYSKVYKDYVNTTVTGNKLLNTISFSIDIQNLSFRQLDKRLPF